VKHKYDYSLYIKVYADGSVEIYSMLDGVFLGVRSWKGKFYKKNDDTEIDEILPADGGYGEPIGFEETKAGIMFLIGYDKVHKK
jgi:hypothetical protein